MTTETHPIALITGGSRGLGRSMALTLADQGSDIIFTFRTNEAEAKNVVDAILAKGRKALALRLDVGDTKSFETFVAGVRDGLGRVFGKERFDFLVNNAGMGTYASFAETTEAQFDELMNAHLKGPFFLTQKLLPLIADGGRILNVSSGLARFSYPGYSAYATMKGAIETLTRYQAQELGPRGINVNVVAPGAIATDFGGGHVRDNAELNRRIASQTALGRVGEADDVGQVVAGLLGPTGQWINGQRIEVAGGIHL